MNTIRYWQERLNEVYPNLDKSPDYMMAHAYTACSDLGRLLLRQEADPRRDTAVISALSWLISLSNHFEIDFETALVKRFPGVCSYCLGRPCECDRTGRRAKHRSGRVYSEHELSDELNAKYNSIRNPNTEISWPWFLNQLAVIYPSNRALLSRGGQSYVVGKMLEEGGELHRAYSGFLLGEDQKHDIEVELADLSAWVASCWDLDGIGRDLGAEFASLYARGCFRCKSAVCRCPTYSITKSQEELVREISAKLRELGQSGFSSSELDEALTTAADVSIDPTPEKKRSLLEKARGVVEIAKGARDTTGAVHQTAKSIGDLADMFAAWVP